ncbi:hypothetical protein H1R20_g12978, partial [Candolleomyces eurysporus]
MKPLGRTSIFPLVHLLGSLCYLFTITWKVSASIVISQDTPVPVLPKGRADIIGFNASHAIILRNTGYRSQFKHSVIPFNQGGLDWRVDRHPRLVGDIQGFGDADIVEFGDEGVYISRNSGHNGTFTPSELVLGAFGYGSEAGSWRTERHLRFLVDLRNTGKVDIIGFGEDGVYVSLNEGSDFAPPTLVLPHFAYAGWKLDRHLRFLADLTGDGLLDIVGFYESGVYAAANLGNGSFSNPGGVFQGFYTIGQGWQISKHPRFFAHLTSSGRADIVGFGDAGVYVSVNNANRTFTPPRLVLNKFGYDDEAGAWRVGVHPRFVADVNGDGLADIVGFANDGTYVAVGNGDGTFQEPKFAVGDFGYDQGWTAIDKYPRFVVDLTGDGAVDIVGFGEGGIYVAFNDGKGNFEAARLVTKANGYGGGTWTVRFPANVYK